MVIEKTRDSAKDHQVAQLSPKAEASRRRVTFYPQDSKSQKYPRDLRAALNHLNLDSKGPPKRCSFASLDCCRSKVQEAEGFHERLMKHALAEAVNSSKPSAALLRTAAMHAYDWRSIFAIATRGPLVRAPTAIEALEAKRCVYERHAEALLTRALECEPFHWLTMASLAFVMLQQGGDGAVIEAGELLERVVKCAGRRGAKPDDTEPLLGRSHDPTPSAHHSNSERYGPVFRDILSITEG